MNNQAQLNELFVFVIENLKEIKSFVLEYLPLLAKEIVAYELYSSMAIVIIALVIISIIHYALYRTYQSEVKEGNINASGPPIFIIGFLCTLIASVVITAETFDVIKTINAPHLVIFEKISNVLR